jgi:hypothetical protein
LLYHKCGQTFNRLTSYKSEGFSFKAWFVCPKWKRTQQGDFDSLLRQSKRKCHWYQKVSSRLYSSQGGYSHDILFASAWHVSFLHARSETVHSFDLYSSMYFTHHIPYVSCIQSLMWFIQESQVLIELYAFHNDSLCSFLAFHVLIGVSLLFFWNFFHHLFLFWCEFNQFF